jgi:hypothetical protein
VVQVVLPDIMACHDRERGGLNYSSGTGLDGKKMTISLMG